MKVFLFVFSFSVAILSSCQENTIKYPLDIVVHGPYDQIEYESIKKDISFVPSDTLARYILSEIERHILSENEMYTAEIFNQSKDTLLIAVSQGVGLLWPHYFCFYRSKDKCLTPGGGRPSIIDDIEQLDTVLPNSSKRYIFRLEEIKNKDLISISFDIKSPFFDSINTYNPIRYYWHDRRLFDAKHPAFLFQISENRSLVPATSINIQAGLNRCKEK